VPELDVLQDMKTSDLTALEAILLQNPRKPIHAFWYVFHTAEFPYIVIDVDISTPTGGVRTLHEVRFTIGPSRSILPHPHRGPRIGLRELAIRREEAHWVQVSSLKTPAEYVEQISPGVFHLGLRDVEAAYNSQEEE
jgi:hypothetical protein